MGSMGVVALASDNGFLFWSRGWLMYLAQCLLPVFLPVLFWAFYHYYKDRHLPEPPGHLVFAMILGVGAFYLGLALYTGLGYLGLRYDAFLLAETNLAGLFAYAMLVIGPFEELAKFIPFWIFVVRFREFDEPVDGIIYSSFIALGFAAVENIYYLQFQSGIEAWGRAFAGPVLHIVFASVWGYYIARAYLCKHAMLPVVMASLAGAAAIHGLYDFMVLGLAPKALPFATLIVVVVWIWRLKKIRYLHELPPGRCPPEEGKTS